MLNLVRAEPEQPKESVFDFPKNGYLLKGWMEGGVNCIFIGFAHIVIFRDLK